MNDPAISEYKELRTSGFTVQEARAQAFSGYSKVRRDFYRRWTCKIECLNVYGHDPLYKAFLNAHTRVEAVSTLNILRQIRGNTAVDNFTRFMQQVS